LSAFLFTAIWLKEQDADRVRTIKAADAAWLRKRESEEKRRQVSNELEGREPTPAEKVVTLPAPPETIAIKGSAVATSVLPTVEENDSNNKTSSRIRANKKSSVKRIVQALEDNLPVTAISPSTHQDQASKESAHLNRTDPPKPSLSQPNEPIAKENSENTIKINPQSRSARIFKITVKGFFVGLVVGVILCLIHPVIIPFGVAVGLTAWAAKGALVGICVGGASLLSNLFLLGHSMLKSKAAPIRHQRKQAASPR